VVGHGCYLRGANADESRVDAHRNWGPARHLSEVRAFSGTVGVMRNFIRISHTGRIT